MEQNQTINKLRQMRLSAMAELHYQQLQSNQLQKFTADEYVALLIQHEWEDRQNKKTDRLLKTARFKQNAAIVEVDYSHVRNLDKNMFDRLGTMGFLKKKENIILTNYPRVYGDIVLYLNIVAQHNTRGNDYILAEIAVFSDFAAWHDVRKMPYTASFSNFTTRINYRCFVAEKICVFHRCLDYFNSW